MKEKLRRSTRIAAALALLSAAAAPAAGDEVTAGGDEVTAGGCVVQALELDGTGEETRVRIRTAGAPDTIGARVEPAERVALDLAGCVAGPDLAGSEFAEGLVAALQFHNGAALQGTPMVVVEVRSAFEYSVSSVPGAVLVNLRAKDGAADAEPRRQRVRVLEPLPIVAPRTPLPASAPPPEPPPPEPPPPPVDAAVAAAVEDWARAWSEQRIEDYLAAYAAGFQPPEGLSRPQWELQRRRRVAAPRWIEVEVVGLEVRPIAPGSTIAAFTQSYRSDTYGDQVDKTLTMVEENGRWRILREEVD